MFYSNWVYPLVLLLVFASWAASEIFGPVRWSGKRKGAQRDRGSLLISFFIGVPAVVGAALIPALLPGARISWFPGSFFLGIVLILFGVAWRWYAILTLGEYFTATVVVQESQPVIQHGPYRLIRHPSYSGVLVLVIGFGLMLGNWASLFLFTICVLTGLLYRISVEEAALLQGIGQPYAMYRKRTKRLIPYIF